MLSSRLHTKLIFQCGSYSHFISFSDYIRTQICDHDNLDLSKEALANYDAAKLLAFQRAAESEGLELPDDGTIDNFDDYVYVLCNNDKNRTETAFTAAQSEINDKVKELEADSSEEATDLYNQLEISAMIRSQEINKCRDYGTDECDVQIEIAKIHQ